MKEALLNCDLEEAIYMEQPPTSRVFYSRGVQVDLLIKKFYQSWTSLLQVDLWSLVNLWWSLVCIEVEMTEYFQSPLQNGKQLLNVYVDDTIIIIDNDN